MSSEVCPFCGKTYKRLKSHLPHCKERAASSKTPPTKHDAAANQTASSQLAAAPRKPTAKGEMSTQTLSTTASPQSKRSKKTPAVTSATPSQSSATSSLSPESPPASTKKKKQKLSHQIKAATIPSSSSSATISTQSQPSPPPDTSKPKKKSLRALIEAAKSKQVPASEDLRPGSAPLVPDPLRSETTAQAETKTNPNKDSEDNAHPAFLSTDSKPKSASKTKLAKTKKAAQSLPTTEDTSSSQDSKVNEGGASSRARKDFLPENNQEPEDLSVNKVFLKSGGAHQARITLQDVKATLGRQSSRPSILSQIEASPDLSSKIRAGARLAPLPLPTENQETSLPTKFLSEQLPSATSQHAELQSVRRKSPKKPKQTSLIPRRDEESPRFEPTTPLLSSRLSQATSSPRAASVNMNEGLRVTGLPVPSLTQLSNPHRLLPLAPQTLPARVETSRADGGLMMEKSQPNTADHGTTGVVSQRRLGQVRLRELPEWLACRTPTHPKDVVDMVQRGWQWYYRRYIDVKKGGVGGLGMLLAGYCVLSYIWSYPHIKHDRWRKYH